MVDAIDEDRAAAIAAFEVIRGHTVTAVEALAGCFKAYGEARYRKGVEDAARVCENECDEVRFEDRNAIARNIRKLGAV